MRIAKDMILRSAILMLVLWGTQLQAIEPRQGVLILASAEGSVRFLDQDGEPGKLVKPGEPIPPEYSVITGTGAKMLALLSNGTLLTIGENTRFRVGVFEQEPFRQEDVKMSELEKEPSKSKVILELEEGSMILKTKKLDKDSSLDIHSPLGFAGIRGTEFQMASTPGQGVQLDVTESTVSFTPPGGGPPIAVSEGSGLSAPPGVTPSLRPVNPTVARKIEVSNKAAVEATSEISLEQVSAVIEEVAAESESLPADDTSTKEEADPDEEESAEPSNEEDAQGEDAPPDEDGQAAPEDDSATNAEEEPADSEPKEAPAEDSSPGKEDSEFDEPEDSRSQDDGGQVDEGAPAEKSDSPKESKGESAEPSNSKKSSSKETPAKSKAPAEPAPDSDSGNSKGQAFADRPAPGKIAKKAVSMEVDAPQNAVLENNAEIAQARKTGKFDARTKELARFGLGEEQTLRFYDLSDSAQAALLREDRAVVRRLLGLEGFGPSRADAFFEYRSKTRLLILTLEDGVMLTLLDQGIEEPLLEESLTKMNVDFSKSGALPRVNPLNSLDERSMRLSERLMESENGKILEELQEMSQGEWTEEILRIGEVADSLLRDYDLGDFAVSDMLEASEVMGNPFYSEVSALYEQLQVDGLIRGQGVVAGARNLIVPANAKILATSFSSLSGEVMIAASENLRLLESFEWEHYKRDDSRLVVMSGGDLTLGTGASLLSATSDLVLAARQNLLLSQVTLEAAREVAIRGLRDVSLRDVTIGAEALATIKARRDLDVDGLVFKRDISRIVMEATTLRLKNVNFPGASQVRLNSLHGPIDGKYPNFGRSIPAAQQIGRVNFIENVRSGGNLLMDRPSFDLHGKNVQIGKIARP